MICESTQIKAKYKLGLIETVNTSADGCVRSATVKYTNISGDGCFLCASAEKYSTLGPHSTSGRATNESAGGGEEHLRSGDGGVMKNCESGGVLGTIRNLRKFTLSHTLQSDFEIGL